MQPCIIGLVPTPNSLTRTATANSTDYSARKQDPTQWRTRSKHKLEIKGSNYFVRSYVSLENTGNSYNLKPLADNLDLDHLSNTAWTSKFKASLQSEINAGTDLAEAMRRPERQPTLAGQSQGTEQFRQLKDSIIAINNWDHISAVPTGTKTVALNFIK